MTALGAVGTVTQVIPNAGIGCISLVTAATVDDGDTITVDLTKLGAYYVNAVIGFIESTTGSIVLQEQPTTSATTGTLTITVGGSTDNKVRTYYIFPY